MQAGQRSLCVCLCVLMCVCVQSLCSANSREGSCNICTNLNHISASIHSIEHTIIAS